VADFALLQQFAPTPLHPQLLCLLFAVALLSLDAQEAAAVREDPFFPTTKLQLSFGLHVIVTMGTFFALGYYGGLILLHSQSWVSWRG
jgi:hypothetical protein